MNASMLKGVAPGLLLAALAVASPAPSAAEPRWVVAWGAAPDSVGPPLQARTVRQIIRAGIGGSSVRIRLSNLFGTAPVTIGPVRVARHAGGCQRSSPGPIGR